MTINTLCQHIVFVFLFCISANSLAEYSVCRDNIHGKEFIECNRKGCPSGSSFVAWNPSNHPTCGASSQCPSIISLGWTSGHKTKFCRRHGFGGVIAAAECKSGKKYRHGGWCYKEGAMQSCRAQLGCK